jgi:glycosyltransferase involved in cell wall biosynthesis
MIDLPRRGIDAPPRAIFIGRLVKFKGLDVLLRPERVPDLRLDIVGAGPEGPRLRTSLRPWRSPTG